jgi:putative transposase
MTKPTIALADLVEKGADADLLKQMIQHVVERVMEFDVENLCNAAYGERSAERAATAIVSGSGRRAPAP